VTEPAREEVQGIEAAFKAGRPYESLARLGDVMRGGVDGELIADAFVTLHRTHGIGAGTGALVLAAAMGVSREALNGHLATIEEHQMQRLLPEVLGRVIYLALAEDPEPGTVDVERWPDGQPTRTREDVVGTIRYMAEHAEDLEWAADRLDSASREVLTQRLVYLTLGHERAQVGPPSDELERLASVASSQLRTVERVRGLGYMDAVNERDFLFSHRFDLRPIGFPITLETSMFGVQATYQLQQYWAPNHPEARPREGDVVVDGGGYLGETALWFAHVVGETGRVLTIELEKGALGVLRENLEANPELASRIAINEQALWDEPGHELPILVSGPGTTVMAGTTEPADEGDRSVEQLVPTTSVDALVASGELERVDFLKLDIEGVESAALKGAEQTLRRFTPRLALAAYHQFDDMWALMRQIDQLELGYRFAMAHFTPHHEETVLYAWVPDASDPGPLPATVGNTEDDQ
jgi:FkbM family methyltransferase